jgi:hypothetical protein
VKIAIATTSISVPVALSVFRAWDNDVMFFVVGDKKTPEDALEFCEGMENCLYLGVGTQAKRMKYKSLDHTPWNCDSRRNLAVLEALKWGADIILSWDDDVLGMDQRFWFDVEHPFSGPFNGLQLGLAKQWFNAGEFATPVTKQRGLPYDTPFYSSAQPVTNVTIGAAQGIILGVPDCDAATAITNTPMILNTSDVLQAGFVVDPAAYCVFNSQITTFRRELAPAFAQFYPHQGRNTDLFASLLMRRIMKEKNWYTFFGLPRVFHARQPRPLLKDLQAERYGVDNIARYADYLNRAPLPKDISVTEQCRILAQGWNGPELEAAMAFYSDCESILG